MIFDVVGVGGLVGFCRPGDGTQGLAQAGKGSTTEPHPSSLQRLLNQEP